MAAAVGREATDQAPGDSYKRNLSVQSRAFLCKGFRLILRNIARGFIELGLLFSAAFALV